MSDMSKRMLSSRTIGPILSTVVNIDYKCTVNPYNASSFIVASFISIQTHYIPMAHIVLLRIVINNLLYFKCGL